MRGRRAPTRVKNRGVSWLSIRFSCASWLSYGIRPRAASSQAENSPVSRWGGGGLVCGGGGGCVWWGGRRPRRARSRAKSPRVGGGGGGGGGRGGGSHS